MEQPDFVNAVGWIATLLAGAASGWFAYRFKTRRRMDKKLTEHGMNLKTIEDRLDRHENGCEARNKVLHDRISNVRKELGEDIDRLGATMGKLIAGQGRIEGKLEAMLGNKD